MLVKMIPLRNDNSASDASEIGIIFTCSFSKRGVIIAYMYDLVFQLAYE